MTITRENNTTDAEEWDQIQAETKPGLFGL